MSTPRPEPDDATPSGSEPPVIPVGEHAQPFVALDYRRPSEACEVAARGFYEEMNRRRTVRAFSSEPVSRETIEWCVRAAGTAPSGAHKQPWRFVCVSDAETKRRIREAAEVEEREFYERRASERWLEDLRPFATDEHKEFLEIAPWLVVVMALKKTDEGGQTYYLNESVGIATGLFLAACHRAGLATLTHTPSPMNFLRTTLERPEHERAYLLIPVGYPAEGCLVPKLERKGLGEIAVFVE